MSLCFEYFRYFIVIFFGGGGGGGVVQVGFQVMSGDRRPFSQDSHSVAD